MQPCLEQEKTNLKRARIIQLDRSYPLCELEQTGEQIRAEFAISLTKSKQDSKACVGDWVLLDRPKDHDKALICSIEPRRSELGRWDGSSMGDKQVLAANVDLVIALVPLQKDRVDKAELLRMLKALVLAYDGSCRSAVVLSKADRKQTEQDLELDIQRVKDCLGALADEIKIIVTSAQTGQGIANLRALVDQKAYCSVLVGQSGAGKSSLANALLGEDLLETAEVRAKDDRGRHTTVARTLLRLPSGGELIDVPGLRSFPLRGHDKGLELAFPEISQASQACKFRDCSHGEEPGCAVRELVEQGELPLLRLDLYRSLLKEMNRMEEKMDSSVRRYSRKKGPR